MRVDFTLGCLGRARGVLTVTFTGNPPQKSSKYEGKNFLYY